jgi:hypothetical protein
MMVLLDIWCSLNSSFGGPLLAIVTVGGFLAIGKSLINFPPPNTVLHIAARDRHNRFRTRVRVFGFFAASVLIVNVLIYVYAFGVIHDGPTVCIKALTAVQDSALWYFFASTFVSATVGTFYSFLLAKLSSPKAA